MHRALGGRIFFLGGQRMAKINQHRASDELPSNPPGNESQPLHSPERTGQSRPTGSDSSMQGQSCPGTGGQRANTCNAQWFAVTEYRTSPRPIRKTSTLRRYKKSVAVFQAWDAGELCFDRFWSCYLRLYLSAKLEATVLTSDHSRQRSPILPELREGELPTLVSESGPDEFEIAQKCDVFFAGFVSQSCPRPAIRRTFCSRSDSVGWPASRNAEGRKERLRTLGSRRDRFYEKSKEGEMRIIIRGLTIIDFIRHPQLLNDRAMSPRQIAFLKSVYGLPLSDLELDIYRRGTGREIYVPWEQQEVTLLGGRRGGKTGKLGARIALYEAFRHKRIPRGGRRYVMLIAPVIAQAKIAFEFILNDIINRQS